MKSVFEIFLRRDGIKAGEGENISSRISKLKFIEKIDPNIKYRITGAVYIGLPDGHRTTLVVGLSEMLTSSLVYCDPAKKWLINAIYKYSSDIPSDNLRIILDEYIESDIVRQKYAISSCYISSLTERIK
jgi:hypothetical protein